MATQDAKLTMPIDEILEQHPLPWSHHLLLIKDANGRQVIHTGGLYSERGALHEGAYLSGLNSLLVELVNSRFAAPASPSPAEPRPRIICLCGSTRFIEQFAIKTWELEREGFIVLGCTLLPMWYCKVPSHFGEATGTKEQCDELHLRKIDLADEVFVLNIDGYIGESTAREIAYAESTGKPVKYLDAAALRASVGEESK